MALDNVANFVKVTVSTTYGSGDTSIVLSGGEGAKLPDPSGDNYNVVWWDATTYSDPSDDPNVEIVRVTAKVSDTLTVARAQESTSDSAKNTGGSTYRMILSPTAKMITDIETELATKLESVEGTAVLSTGEVGGTKFLREDGDGTCSWQDAAGGGGAVTREGGNTTEATTTSTSAVDLLSAGSMSIATNIPLWIVVSYRKTAGAAAATGYGLKINATVTGEADSTGTSIARTSTGNEVITGAAHIYIGSRVSPYVRAAASLASGVNTGTASVGGSVAKTANIPNATITDVIIRGITASASVTAAADELHIYSYAIS